MTRGGGNKFLHLILPYIEVRCTIKNLAPFPDEFTTIALCSGAPHSRPLRLIEHAQLYSCGIGHYAHASTQCINLAHYLSLGYSTNGRVARHLRNLVHIHSDETSLGTHHGSSVCCFTSCVATADNYDIVVKFHSFMFLLCYERCCKSKNFFSIYGHFTLCFRFFCLILRTILFYNVNKSIK